ncbi:MAG: DUF2079 domain-containing protein [Victivallaceae bacterium]
MNYFLVVAICIAIAVTLAAASGKLQFQLTDKRAFQLVCLLAAVTGTVYFLLTLYKYYAMHFGLWDFGIYDSMLHNTAFGKGFMRDYRGPFDHFSPAILLLAPFYWIFDSPVVLIVFQAAVMAAAAVPLFLLAKHYSRKPGIPLLLTAMYLLNPYYSRIALYDFHIECLFPLVFFTAWLAYARHKMNGFMILLICAPLIKEDFIIPLGACGLFLGSRKQTLRYGIICLLAAGLWTLFVLKLWFPAMMEANYQHYGRFLPLLGATPGETFENVRVILQQCFSRNSLAVLVSVLMPFAFLPLFSWRGFILLLCPVVFVHFCSTFAHQQFLMSHYSSAVIAVMPVAALFGWRRLRAKARRWQFSKNQTGLIFRLAVFMTLLTHIVFCELPGVKFYNYIARYRPQFQFGILSVPLWNYWFVNQDHALLFHELRKQIPENLTITAQNNLGYFFVRNRKLYSIPGPPEGTDVYIFDTKTFTGYDGVDNMNRLATALKNNNKYKCLFSQDGLYIFAGKSILLNDKN